MLKDGIVEIYDTSRRPSFGSAHAKRKKKVIKIRIVKYLHESLEEKYNIYLSRQYLSTYLQPCHQNTFAVRRHHHPTKVGLASIIRTKMKSHVDEHYYLVSIKAARIFIEVFSDETIIISQDDKTKVGLGIPAESLTRTRTQARALPFASINEPVTIKDHNFPIGSEMKLIPSIYLVINPADSSNIFEPDENPRHMKNIIQYTYLFHFLDLDYLTVRTYAPGQSTYNPVKRSMASLSAKLAELARQNFEYSGQKLCDI
ncbi:hypothetical protein Glove_291g20 [Diversispora epigaea]|uniref:Uncharacterized protein n=1 Tax=Diversispora epigaea TaxID=1348612 RepID=A0A397I0B1_9GLOM|nr:hypothetical protein Glove_291g20 [Diversispora epigaea]